MPLTVSAACPPGWDELVVAPDHLRFVAADEPRAVQPSFTAQVRKEPKYLRLPELRFGHADELVQAVDAPRLIDTNEAEVDERPASRVLVACVEDGEDVSVEQWIVPLGSRSVVVTATALAPDFATLYLQFQDLVESLSIDV
ncbi:MAG: hypothetical protein JHD16_16560 [Solirubrobacteraceae bacterium]|nr:hypothetical protein [Solirubrobacteraceae bacterium]